MKKILLFTSILFLAFSANIKAQSTPTISNVTVTDSILCNGDFGEITIDIVQSNPATNPLEIVVGSFPFSWNTNHFVKLTSASVLTLTTIVIPSIPPGQYTIRLVDPIAYYIANPNGNGTSSSGIFDTWIDTVFFVEPDSLTASTSSTFDNLCFGDCIAEEELNIQGGTMPYSFSINGGVTQTITTGAGNTQDFVALCEGVYDVVVTDENDCPTLNPLSESPYPDTTYFTITEPSPIVPNGSITSNFNGVNVSCNLGTDGEITANATGGTGVIEFSIDGIIFSNNNIFTGLSVGSYTITYRDQNNCDTTETFTITEPPALSGSLSVTQAVSCFGVCDGELTFSVNSTQIGTPPYQYSIDNGLTFQNSEIFPGLCGNLAYDVMVEDDNGCSFTSSVFLPAPNDISYSLIITDYNGFEISCNGLNDGEITVNTPTGGTPPYQYSSDGGTTYSFNNVFPNLTAGQYTISVIDFNGCTSDTIIDMTEPGIFTLTETIAPVISCPGACDGAVSVVAFNGIAPVNYSLSDGSPTQTTTFWGGLCGALTYGSYDIDAIDANLCTATVNFSITEPPAFVYTVDSVAESCLMSNGQADIDVTAGGTGAWSYLWDDNGGQTTATAFGLPAGTYQVTVTDGIGCWFTEDVEVESEVGFTLSFDSISPCLGGTEGSATVHATGITPLSFLWGNGETTQTISNLPVGIYTVDVTDGTGCTISGSVEVIPATNALMIDSLIISPITCHNANNASIQVLATGGQQFNPDGIANNGDEYYLYSNDNGFSNQTSIGFANLSPNTYIIHVEDAGNCIDRDTIEIVNPGLIEIDSTEFTHISCYGVNDGAIQAINAIGGTPPFEYSVNGGTHHTNMATFNGYGPGTYTIEAYDIYNCTAQDIIIIEEPDELDVTITTSGWVYNPNSASYSYQIQCNGDNSGFANIVVSGGTTPYTRNCYDNNGLLVATSTTSSITGLSAGVYTFEVIDGNACKYYETITYTEPNAIVHNFIAEHVMCSGDSSGSLIDVVSGGVGTATSYIYAWNTGDSTYSLTGIPIGTYTMTVIDDLNCISDSFFTINHNNALNVSTSVTDVSCHDYCDGVITTTVTGGLPNLDPNGDPVYSYQWDDVLLQITENAIGLCVDNLTNSTSYSCVISDGQGCEFTVTQLVIQPEELVVSSEILSNYNFEDISCFGESDGEIEASATGGNSGITYLWNTGQTTSSIANLSIGSYVVTVEDNEGCMDTTEITLTQPEQITISIDAVTHVNCHGIGDGTITASASGGTPWLGIPVEYNYVWSNGFNEQDSSSTAEFLATGFYSVTATDHNGCTITSESEYITQPSDPLTITVDSINESCPDDGQATAFVLGGTPPFSYAWDNGNNQNPNTDLSPGHYSVVVTDDNGCTISDATFIQGRFNILLPGNVTEIDTTICFGNSVFIDIEENTTLTYEWADGPFNGWHQADRLITPTEPVNIYTLEITDPNCEYDISVIINVIQDSLELSSNNSSHAFAVHSISPEKSIHTVGIANGSTVSLTVLNNYNNYNWTWINGNSDEQSITVSPDQSAWYFVEGESAGCVAFDSIYVIVGILPYDAFTPDQNGINDVWNIPGIEYFPSAIVQVFNRWGVIVFETSGDNYDAWDGTNNDTELPVGTYYYIIDLKNDDVPISGAVTIMR